MNSYLYPTIDILKVPGHRSTEPALSELFDAKRERDNRENTFNPNLLTDDDKREEYLASILNKLRIRGMALKYQIYEIGRLLCDAKRVLSHGEFKPWIVEHFDHSYRTAKNCMNVYMVCLGQPEIVQYFNPSCLYIICSPKFPPDLKTALFENVTGPVDLNRKELVETALKFRNGEIDIESEDVQRILQDQKNLDLKERYCIELRALKSIIRTRFKKIQALYSKRSSHPLIKPHSATPMEEMDWSDEIDEKITDFLGSLEYSIRKLKSETVA
jgi:hypothetical protein